MNKLDILTLFLAWLISVVIMSLAGYGLFNLMRLFLTT